MEEENIKGESLEGNRKVERWEQPKKRRYNTN